LAGISATESFFVLDAIIYFQGETPYKAIGVGVIYFLKKPNMRKPFNRRQYKGKLFDLSFVFP